MEELAGVIAAALEGNPDAHSQLETSSTVLSVAAAAMSLLQLADTPNAVAEFAGVLVKRFARNGDADESQLSALCQVRGYPRVVVCVRRGKRCRVALGWGVCMFPTGSENFAGERLAGTRGGHTPSPSLAACVVLWSALLSVLLLFPL